MRIIFFFLLLFGVLRALGANLCAVRESEDPGRYSYGNNGG